MVMCFEYITCSEEWEDWRWKQKPSGSSSHGSSLHLSSMACAPFTRPLLCSVPSPFSSCFPYTSSCSFLQPRFWRAGVITYLKKMSKDLYPCLLMGHGSAILWSAIHPCLIWDHPWALGGGRGGSTQSCFPELWLGDVGIVNRGHTVTILSRKRLYFSIKGKATLVRPSNTESVGLW